MKISIQILVVEINSSQVLVRTGRNGSLILATKLET